MQYLKKNFPLRRIEIKYPNNKPWLSKGLQCCIKHKNKLYYKSIKYRNAYNELKYTTYRNKLKKILIKAEKEHYRKLLNSNKSNMRKTWNILKTIINKNRKKKVQSQFKIGDNEITKNKNLISEKFNNFFTNIGPTLANKIPSQQCTPDHYLHNKISTTLFLSPLYKKNLMTACLYTE